MLHDCASAADRAAHQVGAGRDVEAVAHAAGELLTALGHCADRPGNGPLSAAGARYDRASRTPHQVVTPSAGAVARELRHAARRLGAVAVVTGRGHTGIAAAALVVAVASLVAEIAAWQQRGGRIHQAAAATEAAGALSEAARHEARPRSAQRVVPQAAPQPLPWRPSESRRPGRSR